MKKTRHYALTIFQSADSLWCWHIVAPNGNVIADGAETYNSKGNATRAAKRIMQAFAAGKVDLKEAERP